jgi:type IV pilus assembly protein PilA
MVFSRISPTSRTKDGFTLIELLVVVLILAILMAVAMPLYLSAVATAQRQVCRTNMQTIANAVQSARIKSGSADYTALIAGGVTTTNLPDLLNVPFCPNSGTYTLANGSTGNATTFQVQCNYGTGAAAHGTFQPGLNNN